jgi:hypothetical protein
MGIVWNGAGKLNRSTDTPNNYNGKVGIETEVHRLRVSRKELWLRNKIQRRAGYDASLLGLPAEEDWILYGPYSINH